MKKDKRKRKQKKRKHKNAGMAVHGDPFFSTSFEEGENGEKNGMEMDRKEVDGVRMAERDEKEEKSRYYCPVKEVTLDELNLQFEK